MSETAPDILPTLAREFVDKAEQDYRSAVALHRLRQNRPHDAICFHCQQCAEKYLKALLVRHGLPAPRTHDLLVLLTELAAVARSWAKLQPECARLLRYAVEVRYAGESATPDDSRAALAAVRRVRRRCWQELG